MGKITISVDLHWWQRRSDMGFWSSCSS